MAQPKTDGRPSEVEILEDLGPSLATKIDSLKRSAVDFAGHPTYDPQWVVRIPAYLFMQLVAAADYVVSRHELLKEEAYGKDQPH